MPSQSFQNESARAWPPQNHVPPTGSFDKQWRSPTTSPPDSRTQDSQAGGAWGQTLPWACSLAPRLGGGGRGTPQGGTPIQHSPHATLSTGEPQTLGHPPGSPFRKAGSPSLGPDSGSPWRSSRGTSPGVRAGGQQWCAIGQTRWHG